MELLKPFSASFVGAGLFLLLLLIDNNKNYNGKVFFVDGHGYLLEPSSRNYEQRKVNLDYCPHCLNGGGTATIEPLTVLNDGKWPYPFETNEDAKRHGVCGDIAAQVSADGKERYNAKVSDYEPVTTYKQGDTIDVHTIITAHHRGHIEIYLCKPDSLDDILTQDCFFEHPLERVANSDLDDGPIDETYPTRLYVPPTETADMDVSAIITGYSVKGSFKLPDDITCDHCVLQWYWVTGNSCNALGYEDYYTKQNSLETWWREELSECSDAYYYNGNYYNPYPEEWWNCADITITASNGGTTSEPELEDNSGEVSTTDDSMTCISIKEGTDDEFCQTHNCDPIYSDFCALSDDVVPVQSNDDSSSSPVSEPVSTDDSSSVSSSTAYTNPCSQKKVNIAYFFAWSIYSKEYFVTDIIANKITHLNYGFANVESNGEVVLGDSYADTEYTYPGMQSDDAVKGNFGELLNLKKAFPELKVLISIGGYTWSKNFSGVAKDPTKLERFANSAVEFMQKYNLDGIDIDWLNPVEGGNGPWDPTDKENFTKMLKLIREKLDTVGDGYLLTIAASSASQYANNIEVAEVSKYLDFMNIMTFGFNGPWSTSTSHNAPLYGNDNLFYSEYWNVDYGLSAYLNLGIPKSKLVMGLPMYGRSFAGVEKDSDNGGLYQPFEKEGPSTASTGYGGILDYTDIEENYLSKSGEWIRYWDEPSHVPYLYNKHLKTFISYDDVESIAVKARYINAMGLAGSMFWDLASDKQGELLSTAWAVLSDEDKKCERMYHHTTATQQEDRTSAKTKRTTKLKDNNNSIRKLRG